MSGVELRRGMRLADQYTVGDVLGRGATAKVYKAVDIRNGRTVAAKVFNPTIEGFNALTIKEEYQTQAGLQPHENIIPFYDYSLGTEHPFIIMMHARQGSLSESIRQGGRLSSDRVVKHVLEAAAGLQRAHALGVTHRDVKPNNILLDEDIARVSDFGIAVKGHSPDSDITLQWVKGTLAYMAPEQFDGEATYLSDLYSLGIVAFELATGVKPIQGTKITELMDAHRQGRRQKFTDVLSADVLEEDKTLAAIASPIMKAFSVDDRQPSVAQFSRDLWSAYREAHEGQMEDGTELLVPFSEQDTERIVLEPTKVFADRERIIIHEEAERMRVAQDAKAEELRIHEIALGVRGAAVAEREEVVGERERVVKGRETDLAKKERDAGLRLQRKLRELRERIAAGKKALDAREGAIDQRERRVVGREQEARGRVAQLEGQAQDLGTRVSRLRDEVAGLSGQKDAEQARVDQLHGAAAVQQQEISHREEAITEAERVSGERIEANERRSRAQIAAEQRQARQQIDAERRKGKRKRRRTTALVAAASLFIGGLAWDKGEPAFKSFMEDRAQKKEQIIQAEKEKEATAAREKQEAVLIAQEQAAWEQTLGAKVEVKPLPEYVTPEVTEKLKKLGLELRYIPALNLGTLNDLKRLGEKKYEEELQKRYPKWVTADSFKGVDSNLSRQPDYISFETSYWETVLNGDSKFPQIGGYWMATETVEKPDVGNKTFKYSRTPIVDMLLSNIALPTAPTASGTATDGTNRSMPWVQIQAAIKRNEDTILSSADLSSEHASVRLPEVLEWNLLGNRHDWDKKGFDEWTNTEFNDIQTVKVISTEPMSGATKSGQFYTRYRIKGYKKYVWITGDANNGGAAHVRKYDPNSSLLGMGFRVAIILT